MVEPLAIVGGALVVTAAGGLYLAVRGDTEETAEGETVETTVEAEDIEPSQRQNTIENADVDMGNSGNSSIDLDNVEEKEDDTQSHHAVGPQLDADELTDVKGVGETRAEDLMDAGFVSPNDLYFAKDEDIEAVDGIGPYTVEQIRDDIGQHPN